MHRKIIRYGKRSSPRREGLCFLPSDKTVYCTRYKYRPRLVSNSKEYVKPFCPFESSYAAKDLAYVNLLTKWSWAARHFRNRH